MVVSDFGLSLELHEPQLGVDRRGSIPYMAPELHDPEKVFNHLIDSWSLGVILHELLMGKRPYEHDDMETLIEMITTTDVDFSSDEWEDISIEAIDLVENLLIKDIDKRLTVLDIKC